MGYCGGVLFGADRAVAAFKGMARAEERAKGSAGEVGGFAVKRRSSCLVCDWSIGVGKGVA